MNTATRVMRQVLLVLAFLSFRAYGGELTGNAKAAFSSASSAIANPANAGHMEATEFEATPILFQSKTLRVRYPGSAAIDKDQGGLGPLQGLLPSFVYKPTRNFGIGITDLLPPISINLKLTEIPIVILDQPNFVDINTAAQVKGGFGFLIGYRIFERLSIGAKMSYRSLAVTADVVPAGGGSTLVRLVNDETVTSITLGVRFDIVQDLFSAGIASEVFSSKQVTTSVESPFVEEQEGAGAGDSGADSATGTPFKSVLIGFSLKPNASLMLLTDINYTRANKEETGFSVVEFREKTKEVYDTVGVRTGLLLTLNGGNQLVGGFQYEPASVGPGSRGDDSFAGFGTIDMVTIFADQAPLYPFWSAAGGMHFRFGERKEAVPGAGKRGKKRIKITKPWLVGAGIGYQKAALGIDENGELPGAYLQKSLYFPVTVRYRF